MVTQLLTNSQTRDVIDFIPLISQLTYRFQEIIYPMLDELMSGFLLQMFGFMNQQQQQSIKIQNTTVNSYESQQQTELRRSYVNFIYAILNSTLGAIFTSQRNIKHFETILASMLTFAKDEDPPLQKAALGVLTKMVEIWAMPNNSNNISAKPITNDKLSNAKSNNIHHQPLSVNNNISNITNNNLTNNNINNDMSSDSLNNLNNNNNDDNNNNNMNNMNGLNSHPPISNTGLPGFGQFVYERIIPLCFSIPFSPSFNLQDAQTLIVLGEISAIKKVAYQRLGNELIEYLQKAYLPSIGFPAELIRNYIQALETMDIKAFSKYFKSLVQSKRT